MIVFACIFFGGDVTRRLIIRLGFFLDLFIYLFFLQFYLNFLYVNLDFFKKMKRGAALLEWADFL